MFYSVRDRRTRWGCAIRNFWTLLYIEMRAIKTVIIAQGADGTHRKFVFNTANISSAIEKMETMFPDFKVISCTPTEFYYIEPST